MLKYTSHQQLLDAVSRIAQPVCSAKHLYFQVLSLFKNTAALPHERLSIY